MDSSEKILANQHVRIVILFLKKKKVVTKIMLIVSNEV